MKTHLRLAVILETFPKKDVIKSDLNGIFKICPEDLWHKWKYAKAISSNQDNKW